MKCVRCDREVNIKKNQLVECKCGAKLLGVEINKKLVIEDLSKDEGDIL